MPLSTLHPAPSVSTYLCLSLLLSLSLSSPDIITLPYSSPLSTHLATLALLSPYTAVSGLFTSYPFTHVPASLSLNFYHFPSFFTLSLLPCPPISLPSHFSPFFHLPVLLALPPHPSFTPFLRSFTYLSFSLSTVELESMSGRGGSGNSLWSLSGLDIPQRMLRHAPEVVPRCVSGRGGPVKWWCGRWWWW